MQSLALSLSDPRDSPLLSFQSVRRQHERSGARRPQSDTLSDKDRDRDRDRPRLVRDGGPGDWHKLRRRASQGSLRYCPSGNSRLRARAVAVLQLSPLPTSSVPSAPSAPSAPLSSSSSLSLSSMDHHGPASVKDVKDFASHLPPTPPDDDSHVGWSPRAAVSLLDGDEPPRSDADPGSVLTGQSRRSEELYSPPDRLSASGSCSGFDSMDCGQSLLSCLESGIDTACMLLKIRYFFFKACVADNCSVLATDSSRTRQRKCRRRQDCLANAAVSTGVRVGQIARSK